MKALQKILCVDDESDMRMMIKLSLENVGGYQVMTCATGQELLDNIEGWNPDLIVLDAVMPGMDGLETLSKIKANEKFKTIPVMFMTGKAKEAEKEMLDAGAIGVVIKPFDPIHITSDIQKVWDDTQNG